MPMDGDKEILKVLAQLVIASVSNLIKKLSEERRGEVHARAKRVG